MATEHAVRIGARIRQAREEAGLTQRELADRIPGKSDGTQVSGWERGEHRVSDDTLSHIARILNKDVAWFHADAPVPGTPDLVGELSGGKTQLDRIEARLDWLQNEMVRLLAAQAAEDPEAGRGQG